MLSLGLTGGIAAGKSLLTHRFRELGAVVIDADQLAREVVAPGTSGLNAVVATFGDRVLLPDGSLNRAKLGSVVFADQGARESLNAIVHPRVRAAANALKLDAEPGSIVVQDIPLLVESGQAAHFHLVVVVQAPHEERIARMVRERGMSREDALSRMAAQASDEQRAAVADVLILNDGTPEQAAAQIDALWERRLVPFAANMASGKAAAAGCAPSEEAASGEAPFVGALGAPNSATVRSLARERLLARLQRVTAEEASLVEPAADSTRIMVRQRRANEEGRRALLKALAGEGFFLCAAPGQSQQFLASADPVQEVTVEIVE